MELKINPEKSQAGFSYLKTWLVQLSFLLFYIIIFPQNVLGVTDLSQRKIALKVGDRLNYQINATILSEKDTTKSCSWISFSVVEKKDTVYTLIGRIKRTIDTTPNVYRDTRFPEELNSMSYMRLEKYPAVPFQLTEKGTVLSVSFPDTTIRRLIKEKYQDKLLEAALLIKNLKQLERTTTDLFQQFFINWNLIKEGKKTTLRNPDQLTNITINSIHDNGTTSKFAYTYETLPVDTLRQQSVYFRSNGNSRYTADTHFGTVIEADISKNFPTQAHNLSYKIYQPDRELIQIRKYSQENDSTVLITAALDKSLAKQTLKCFTQAYFIASSDFEIKKEIEPGQDLEIRAPLNCPVVTSLTIGNMYGSYDNLLLEPGDSIHLEISSTGVEYSGRGALKINLCSAMRRNALNVETSLTENLAKIEAEKWINNEQQKIEQVKDRLSPWAYNQIRCDIYYLAMSRLMSYYYYKNNSKVNETSFNILFSDIKWNDYQSFSSTDMMRFIDDYLYRKILIMKNEKENRMIYESDKYNLARIIFKDKNMYHALSQCVFIALKDNNIELGKSLFYDYEKTYSETGFYPYLKKKLESRVDLSNGAKAPSFIVNDINGDKISLDRLKGKYFQLLFIDLASDDDKRELEAYQRLKKGLPKNKFELVTVFTNSNDSLTSAYVSQHHPLGVLIKNADWQSEDLKKYRSGYSTSFYLVNPKGVIVFGGAFSPTDEIVNMIIEMINNDNYNYAEASVSKSTLYWVLSLFSVIIILTMIVGWLITRSIRKKEANRHEQLELKLSAVRSQLNPHFLFNAMTSIQFLVNHNEKEKANLFLSKFAQLMRKVLLQSDTERISLKEELENVGSYLDLEALRHRFHYNIEVEDGIDLFNTEIPVMLLQPFVENAVIHGIAGMEENGTIDITVKQHAEKHIQIRIADNGLGFSPTRAKETGSNGKGMYITQRRAALMMEKYNHEIVFKVVNRNEQNINLTGTEVVITFETEK